MLTGEMRSQVNAIWDAFWPGGISRNVDRVEHLPDRLQSASQSGPTGNPPFLRLSRGHAEIDIGIDGRPGSSTHRARVAIDPETGEPKFDATP